MMNISIKQAAAITPISIFHDLALLRQKAPLIHNIANFVAMPAIANVLLAIGASPIMAHAKNELVDLMQLASALVINIGTLDEPWVESMKQAQQLANRKLIPIVLDPVGAGASRYRTQIAHELLNNGVSIVRGNAAEIRALVDSSIITKGVDSASETSLAVKAAQLLAARYNCIVVISGATDRIITHNAHYSVHNGTPLLTKVTGMGCALTAVIGAFAAINANYFTAAVHAVAAFTIAGQIGEKRASGPGTFYSQLLDVLFQLDSEDLTLLTVEPYAS